MMIRPSAALRNDYAAISELAKTTQEPIYITKNGEGDLVVMSIEAFEKHEQMMKMRERVMRAEAQRIAGEPTLSTEEVRKMLRDRIHKVHD
ncbi:MAG: type II toxin-antitoxin system Phd/YefM family antitoxin [Clostridia bacterium]|nr:type II toxin-antitoxin system Phd/YefM family antitoxin [Clostridia bacterium]MBR0408985.1 type II toxin-antitoxin system Phd/YefM family antitoxin [Clostridia bacterium]